MQVEHSTLQEGERKEPTVTVSRPGTTSPGSDENPSNGAVDSCKDRVRGEGSAQHQSCGPGNTGRGVPFGRATGGGREDGMRREHFMPSVRGFEHEELG